MSLVLISLGIICIPLDAWIWYRDKIGKINGVTIHSTLMILIPVINWFAFAAYRTGLIVTPTTGFYEGTLNIIGLIIAIAPPLIIFTCGFIIAQIVYQIKLNKIRKQRQRKKESR